MRSVYGRERIFERHRHRYEVNSTYRERLDEAGMCFAGLSPDGALAEIVERPDHPWFVGGPVPPGAHLRARSNRIRCSPPSSGPRSSRRGWSRSIRERSEGDVSETPADPAGWRSATSRWATRCRSRSSRAPAPSRGATMRSGVSEALVEMTAAREHSVRLQELLRQGQPHLGRKPARHRHRRGARDPGGSARGPRLPGADRRAPAGAVRGRGAGGWTCSRSRRSSAARPTCCWRRAAHRQGRST